MHRARRRFGQHFLSDPRILSRIADALHPEPGQRVLEIGPGQGALTVQLVKRGAQLTAIEVDRDLVPVLARRFPSVNIVEGDALELDWHEVMRADLEIGDLETFLLTGNIPYNITSPLLEKALTPPRPARIVFLVQKEVADRITAKAGSSDYGALTVGIQSVTRAEKLFRVPAGAFHPPPRVDSAVVRLTPLDHPLVRDDETAGFRRFVTGVFGFRRKQLGRGLRELTGWSLEQVSAVITNLKMDATTRAEVLEPAQFVALFRGIVDGGWASH
jgi:16S rRNA (adenine1518-N6/adenine1519-N6)-dimethyltransferase